MLENIKKFSKAKPIWEADTENEQNRSLLFYAELPRKDRALLRISGHSSYQVFVNRELVLHGPARAGKGYFRVDEIEIGERLTKDKNELVVITAGYNCRCYYFLHEPSFLCAEVVSDECVLCATGVSGWQVYGYDERVRRVQRYSGQRSFCEVYDLCNDVEPYSHLRRNELETRIFPDKNWIERGVSLPCFDYEDAYGLIAAGQILNDDDTSREEFEIDSSGVADGMLLSEAVHKTLGFPYTVRNGEYVMAKMHGNHTGFISFEVICHKDTELVLTFDEILTDGDVNYNRDNFSNIVIYRLSGGKTYSLMTFEPYTYQYLNLIVRKGDISLRKLGMVRVGFNKNEIIRTFNARREDDTMKRIYDAAVETFCQNTYDIFMDCPSRERAGWLCDSFFMARVEHLITGKSHVERNFLSNYVMATSFPNLPDGAIPMCYPAEHNSCGKYTYIPNWMMWYALELWEYFERTGDRTLVDEAKNMLYGVLEFLRKYENSDGLLERLDGWVFIEWSRSNKLVQDINYPTNMLYSSFKRALGRLYSDDGLIIEAESLRKVIREHSRVGIFFCDNSVYENGVAHLSGECTETCQYYAFFTGVATIEEDGELWGVLLEDFGPQRKTTGKWESIAFSNAFIGNYLRLDLLAKEGYLDRLEENIREYFGYMAELTGTLWEYDSTKHSCCHGFASHVLVWLDKLGYLNDTAEDQKQGAL